MRRPPSHYLAWSLWAAVMGLGVAIVLLDTLVPYFRQSLLTDLTLLVVFVAMATTGTIVASRNPGNPIGWLLLFFPLVGTVAGGMEGYLLYTVNVRPGSLPGGELVGLVASALWVTTFGQLTFLLLLFPTGTLLSARWRWVVGALVGVLALLAISSSLGPELGLLQLQPSVRNPFAIPGAEDILNAIATLALVAIALLFIAATVSLVLRFFRSTWEERQQIKWFAYAAGVFAAYVVIIILVETVTGSPAPEPLSTILFAGFLLLLTLGMAVAILKYRLYDIDLVINRTMVYGPLTALVAGTYIAGVQLFRTLFIVVIGEPSDAAVVLTTLVAAAVFWSVRARLQAFVDKHFKDVSDPTRELAEFSERVRQMLDVIDTDTINLEQIARRLLVQATRAFDAESGAVYLNRYGEAPVHTTGDWHGEVHASGSLEAQGVTVGRVELGPRHAGRGYSERDIQKLQASMAPVAEVIVTADSLPRPVTWTGRRA